MKTGEVIDRLLSIMQIGAAAGGLILVIREIRGSKQRIEAAEQAAAVAAAAAQQASRALQLQQGSGNALAGLGGRVNGKRTRY